MMLPTDEVADPAEEPVLFDQRHQASRGVEEEGGEGNGSFLLADDPAWAPPDGGQPVGDLLAVADRRREEQEVDPDGEVDHDLLPDDAAVPVAEEVGLVEDDQVAVQALPGVHRVVELIPEDLGGPRDDRGVGVFLRVAGDDADVDRAEEVAEFNPFGVGQGLQGGGVPAAPALLEDRPDRFFGDPGLSRTGRGHDETVIRPDRVEGLQLKGVRPKLRGDGFADLREDRLQERIRLGFHPLPGPCSPLARRRAREGLAPPRSSARGGRTAGKSFVRHGSFLAPGSLSAPWAFWGSARW